jgi:hypothetical protein
MLAYCGQIRRPIEIWCKARISRKERRFLAVIYRREIYKKNRTFPIRMFWKIAKYHIVLYRHKKLLWYLSIGKPALYLVILATLMKIFPSGKCYLSIWNRPRSISSTLFPMHHLQSFCYVTLRGLNNAAETMPLNYLLLLLLLLLFI